MKLEQYKLIKETNEPSNQLLIIAMVLFVFNLFFAGFGISLWDDDESAYAGFALRMIETGDWVNPKYMVGCPQENSFSFLDDCPVLFGFWYQ